MVRSLVLVAACAAALAARPSTAAAEDPPRAVLLAVDGGTRTELPLVASAMHAEVRGPIARVAVTQTFSNPADRPIELIYVFPLHEDGAVGAMTMTIGRRTIRAKIDTREAARAAYEGARSEGKTAALLEEERPNIFTQSVANVLPGESIDIDLVYDVLLDPDGDVYELALPTVVGPRYNPGAPLGAPPRGTGVQPDTTIVPDASRISPEAAPPGSLTGNVVTVDVDVDAGLPIASVESPTHRIAAARKGADRYQVRLADGDMVADRDFVLRWRVHVAEPTLAALAHREGADGHLALMVQPPPLGDVGRAPPRELVFVVDTSGSMSGEPLALAKRGMRYALEHLRPEDSFRLLNFFTDVAGFEGGRSMPATKANVRAALSYVNGVGAGGGTEMLNGIIAALADPPADGRPRFVVLMTDGFIGNEDEIFAGVKARLDPTTHLFGFGVGSSVNRHLLDGLARFGKGAVQYLLLDEAPEPQVATFYRRLDSPLLHDLHVDWGGLDVVDESPAELADLFAGQPLVVAARYRKGGRGTIRVTGQAAGRTLELAIPVELPDRGGDGEVLGRLWARRRIGELMDRLASNREQAVIDDITRIALAHSLLSPWTAFVAIDELARAEGMPTDTVPVPVELPAGVTPAAGNVIGGEYSANVPTGRSFGAVIGTAAGSQGDGVGLSFSGSTSLENQYIVDGVNTTGLSYGTIADDAQAITTLHLSLAGGLGLGDGDRAFGQLGLGIDRRFTRLATVGLEARLLARPDSRSLLAVLFDLARLAILGHVDLHLGLGLASTTDVDLGLAWKGELSVPVPLTRRLATELTLGVTGVTAADGHLGAGLGIGVRW